MAKSSVAFINKVEYFIFIDCESIESRYVWNKIGKIT